MSDIRLIYRNARGEIKYYEALERRRDATHLYAVHDGRLKTFRRDAILEALAPDDDQASHLAYWQAETAKDRPAASAPERLPLPDAGQTPGISPQSHDKTPRLHWRSFWLGFAAAWAVVIAIVVLVPGPA